MSDLLRQPIQPAKPIRVMLVDDHDVVRRGLSVFLSAFDDMELVGEASNGQQAVQLCEQIQPDVILMDIIMPKMDGIEATRLIRLANPTVQIVILTSSKEEDMVKTALQVGAVGYLLKNTTFDEMARAIRAAYKGNRSLSVEATDMLIQSATRPPVLEYNLTEREREVLTLVTHGLSNPQISEKLVVSLSTVKFHISSILAKLSVTSRTEAVALAIAKKLVD